MVLLTSQDSVLKAGMRVPDFMLASVDGKTHSLSDARGKKATLVVFMCNHCPYVIPKMKYLVHLQETYGPHGFQLIAINSNDPAIRPEDSFEHMKVIAHEKGFNFPYLFDESQKTAKQYGAVCTPDPFLLNGNFELVYHGRFDDAHGKGHQGGTTQEIEDALKELLAGKPVTVPFRPSMGCSIKWKKV